MGTDRQLRANMALSVTLCNPTVVDGHKQVYKLGNQTDKHIPCL